MRPAACVDGPSAPANWASPLAQRPRCCCCVKGAPSATGSSNATATRASRVPRCRCACIGSGKRCSDGWSTPRCAPAGSHPCVAPALPCNNLAKTVRPPPPQYRALQERRRLRGCEWLCRTRHATSCTARAFRAVASDARRAISSRLVDRARARSALLSWASAAACRYAARQRTYTAGCHAWWAALVRTMGRWAEASHVMGGRRQRAISLERRSLHWRAPRLQARSWARWAGTLGARSTSVRYLRRALAHRQSRAILHGWRNWHAYLEWQSAATARLIHASPPRRRAPVRRAGEATHPSEAMRCTFASEAIAAGGAGRGTPPPAGAGSATFDGLAAAPPSFDLLLDRIVVLQQLVDPGTQPEHVHGFFAQAPSAAAGGVAAR
eukprot:1746748-Prymnesium_polylepis.1